jgi:uridine kinase
VRAGPARLGPVRLVTVDGPAGSGKSTFAGRLAAELRAAGSVVEEVATDDLLDGWVDLDSFWPRLESGVLVPLAAGRPGGYRSYDWDAGRFRRQRTPVAVPDVLIVEGVTSTRAVGPGRTTVAIRIFAPRDLRLSRGIARDGERLLPQWLHWMRAEDDYMAQDPPGADDVLVDGASTFPHDARREYVEAGG